MNNTQYNELKIAQWNARSFRNHVQEFYHFMNENNIQIAFISETNFYQTDIVPSNNNYVIHRLDRTTSSVRSGGVAIIIKRNISYELLQVPQTELIEVFGVKVKLLNGSFIQFYTAYLPGGTPNSDISLHYRSDLLKLTSIRHSYFVFGDFNSRHQLWSCFSSNLAGRILQNLHQQSNFIIHHPHNHTYHPADINRRTSMLDIVITNGLHQITNSINHPSSSDHDIVTHNIEITQAPQTRTTRRVPCFRLANWPKYQEVVEQELINLQLNTNSPYQSINDLDQVINEFSDILLSAQEQSVPTMNPTNYGITLTSEIKDKIRFRNTLVRQKQRSHHPSIKAALRSQINNLNYIIQQDIKELENEDFGNMVSSITNDNNNHKLWKTSKFLKNRRNFMPPLKDNDSTLITPQEKSEALATQFLENHTNPLSEHNKSFTKHVNATVNRFMRNCTYAAPELTTATEVTEIARSLKNPKSPGLDKVHNRLIKNLPPIGFLYLTLIINSCLHLSYFPLPWKHAKMIPIRKPGKPPQNPSSYRPISLLSSLSKILERVILRRLNAHLTSNNVIPDQQHGFRANHSTTTQLQRITSHIKTSLRQKLSIGLVSLDMEKCFDRVWHNGLIYKLIMTNTPHYIIKIIHSFLQNRTFQVSVNNHLSNTHSISFGVPQGSVLSPTLYNIFIHDIPQIQNCQLALYADDTALFCTSRFAKHIINNLEKGVKKINSYYTRWKMSTNNNKTQVIFFTKRRTKQLPHRNFKIGDVEIEWQNTLKYLGIIFDKKLTFKDHIQTAIAKTNAATKILYSLINRRSRLNQNSKLLLYKVALRPIITYACPIFSTASKTHLQKLQICQNKLLRTILNSPPRTTTVSIHQTAEIETITEFIHRLTVNFQDRLDSA